ncbi:pilin [Patescibacteria group bacterium]|nr:pilin [Patescibacteria group bacterium]
MTFILKKCGFFLLLITLFLGGINPVQAQDTLFDDPLDAIKDRLEEEDIKVADYSETDWGNLPPEVIEILDLEGAGNLDDVAGLAEYDQALGNVDALTTYLEGLTFIDGTPFDNDTVSLIVNEIRFRGESQIQSVVLSIVKVFRNLLGSLAIIWIVIAGIRMIMAYGNEETIKEQKNSIIYAMIGLAIVLILERLIVLVYGVPGVERGVIPEAGAGIDAEILGLVSFIKALIGAVAILMIIISGYKTIAASGEEEKITEQKRSILWIVIGLVIIAVNQIFVENLYLRPIRETGDEITTGNVGNIIATIGTILQFILGFVGLIAFAAMIYGAASMIANYGNDEMVQRAKSIIKNAIIGIIIILSAFALVSTLML